MCYYRLQQRMTKNRSQASRVGFFNFFKLSFLFGLALGQLAGAWFLVAGICGGPVDLNLGSWHVKGLPAGIGGMILMPPLGGLAALVAAPVLFFPFTLACNIFGGFKVSN